MFQDHFSNKASIYAEHRPSYPAELIDFLASVAPATDLAWDCGCGSGQMAVPLAERFARVIATDASAEQVAHATPRPRVEYRHAPAERSGIQNAAVDLIVAAQSAHWFDLPAFYAEAQRVARPGGVIALVTYDLLEVNAEIDHIVRDFYASLTWPPERRLVEQRYASMPFPFEEMDAPRFFMLNEWNAEQLIGYVHTWSAVRETDTSDFEKEVRAVWSDDVRPVRWPIAMRLGRTS